MKKTLISLCLVFIFFGAKSQIFHQNSKNVNLGLGLGYGLGVTATGEVGLNNVFGLGAGLSLSTQNRSGFSSNYRANYFTLGLRGSMHLNKFLSNPLEYNPSKLDLYLGLSPYFRSVSYPDDYRNNYSGVRSGIDLGGYVGARYHFSPSTGLYLELGFPYTSFGLSFKM